MDIIVTERQLKEMKHAVGFNRGNVKRGRYAMYRNYFTTPGRCESWDKLVEMGLAERSDGQCGYVYCVTNNGIEFLSGLLEVKLVESN